MSKKDSSGLTSHDVDVPSSTDKGQTYNEKFIEIWNDEDILDFVKKFYTNIKKAMPIMLAYRY